MNGEVTARSMALANILICDINHCQPKINKVSPLHFIANQLARLHQEKSISFQAAFCAHWLNKWQPFDSLNDLTAATIAVAVAGGGADKIGKMRQLLIQQPTLSEIEICLINV